MLIINADDYGATRDTTERIIKAFRAGSVTSASIMVFMEDSEFAARQAIDNRMDTGLHINYTAPLTARGIDPGLSFSQEKIIFYLRRGKFAQFLYNPLLVKHFRKSFQFQFEEYVRLFGRRPSHLDGHHHMHLCANSLFGGFYPASIWVRRSFTFKPREKGYLRWIYRRFLDRQIRRKYRITDYFYSIEPIRDLERLRKIMDSSSQSLVELETHPAREEELDYLLGHQFRELLAEVKLTDFSRVGRDW